MNEATSRTPNSVEPETRKLESYREVETHCTPRCTADSRAARAASRGHARGAAVARGKSGQPSLGCDGAPQWLLARPLVSHSGELRSRRLLPRRQSECPRTRVE